MINHSRKELKIMNIEKLTIKTQAVIEGAQQIASSNHHQFIENIHLLKAMLADDNASIPFLLKKCGVNPQTIKEVVNKQIQSLPTVSGNGNIYISQTCSSTIEKAFDL